MIPLTLSQIVAATDGRLVGEPDAEVTGPVVTDSRQVEAGSLFVARRGETSDGHEYVAVAQRAGAVAALVEHEVAGVSLPQVVVKDSQTAFGRVAHAVIEAGKPGLSVIAVTGSSGKTTTKDLLAHVLSVHAPTVAAAESFNSEIGVPLTVCRATPDTRHLVVEMGARGIGHLRYLTSIAPPDISVVLNVGYAHAGEFGGIDAIEQAKGELVEALTPQGVAVLNLDDERVARMASRTRGRVVTVSASGRAEATVRAEDVTLVGGCPSFRLVTPQGAADVTMRLVGAHHVGNALSTAAVALEAGMTTAQIAAALGSAVPDSRWRMEVTRREDGVTVVNDAYNANPDSMAAALRAIVTMGGRRTVAVLGEMLELGPESAELHREVGSLAGELNVDTVVAVGTGAEPIAEGARQAGVGTVEVRHTADDAREWLARVLRDGDVVLFKSSRDSGLRWLGEAVAASGGSDR